MLTSGREVRQFILRSPPGEGGRALASVALTQLFLATNLTLDSSFLVALNALLSRVIADRFRGNTHSCIVLFPPRLSTSCLYCEKVTFSRWLTIFRP